MTDNNVVQFPNKEKLEELSETDKYNGRDLRTHFDHFLNTLDASVDTFMELSAAFHSCPRFNKIFFSYPAFHVIVSPHRLSG